MSILDKYPAPWTFADDAVKDATGRVLFSGGCVGMDNAALEIDDDVRRLVLAAPELLELVREHFDRMESELDWDNRAEALIARIEGK